MESAISNPIMMTIIIAVGAIGIAVCWFGVLIAAVTALGNKRWFWGLSTFLLGPITGIPYTFIYKEADYPRSLMIKGVGLLAISSLIYFAVSILV